PQFHWIAVIAPLGSFSMIGPSWLPGCSAYLRHRWISVSTRNSRKHKLIAWLIVVASGPRGSSRWAPFSYGRPRTSYGREPFVGQDSDHKERRGLRWPLLESRPFLAKNSVANDRDGGSRSWLRLLRSEL